MAYPFQKMNERKLKQFAEELKRKNITFTDAEKVLIENHIIKNPLKNSSKTVSSDRQSESINLNG